MQRNRPNKCITTEFLAAGAVLSLNPLITKKKLILWSSERPKHFAPNINSYSVTNKPRDHNNKQNAPLKQRSCKTIKALLFIPPSWSACRQAGIFFFQPGISVASCAFRG